MENIIIIGLLAVIVVFALLRFRKHFAGGGCCGSTSTDLRSKKKLTEPKIGEKMFTVEGMHCEKCQNKVEHAVNNLDGVVCKVNLKKKTATISYSEEVSDDALKAIIEKLGYQVTSIR